MKVTADGTISTHTKVDHYPYSLAIDAEDNLYILHNELISNQSRSVPAVLKFNQATGEPRPSSPLPLTSLLDFHSPHFGGIAVNANGTSLYATDHNVRCPLSVHNTVHGVHLGFPYYKNKIENTLTTETNSPHPDPPLTTTPVTPSTSTVTSSNRQTSHWKKNLTLGGLVLAGTTATGLYLTNSIVNTYTNPNAPSRDHWDPAVESWLPGWMRTTTDDLQEQYPSQNLSKS